jgi:hypothetical protein
MENKEMKNKEMENKEMETTQQIDEVGAALTKFGKAIYAGLRGLFTPNVVKFVQEEMKKSIGALAKSNKKILEPAAIIASSGYKKSISILVEDLAVKRFKLPYKDLTQAQKNTVLREAGKNLNDVIGKEVKSLGRELSSDLSKSIDTLKGAELVKMGNKTKQIADTIAAMGNKKLNKASDLLKTNAQLVGTGKQGAALLSKVKGGKVNIVKGGQLYSANVKTLGQSNIKVFRLSRGQWKTLAALGITGAAVLYLIGKLYPNDAVTVIDDSGNDGTQGGGNTGGGNTGGGSSTKYTPCTSFPMVYGCKSDQIREVQSCLGMSQDLQTGNFGPKTMAALGGLKELTKEKYDAIIAKCKGTQIVPAPQQTATDTGTLPTPATTLPPITPPAKPAEPVMDKNRLQELLSSNNLVVRRNGKVVVWKGPKLSGPDYYILSKSLEEKGYTEVRQRETGDRGDEDITMKYKWKKLD